MEADPRTFTPEALLAETAWMRTLARALVRDADAADDLVQDTVVAALRAKPELDRGLRPWLGRVLRNAARAGHDAEPGLLVASVGLHRMDWAVPRFEVGYWRRAGHGGRGYVAEAVQALTRLCFDRLGARRVEIRLDDGNDASRHVAERAGFTLEAVLRGDSLDPAGMPRSTRVYARVRGVEERAAG